MLGFYLGRALLPQVLFFILLAAGWYLGRLSGRTILTLLVAWLAGVLVAGLLPLMVPLFTACVALVDVVLILAIVKSDIRI